MKQYISASGLKKFRDCPKQWWYHYVSGVDPQPEETKWMDLGSAVHEAIEDTLKESMRIATPEEQVLATYRVKAEEFDVPDDVRERGEEYCKRAVEYIEKQEPDIRGVEAEADFSIDRPDVKTRVVGKMDLTTEGEVWDWKTGSIRDKTAEDEAIQGGVYAAAFWQKYGEWPELIRFVYLKEEEVRKRRPDQELANTVLQYARALSAAKQAQEYEAQPGDVCDWCPYEMHCPESGVGVGNFNWEEWVRV